MTDLAFATAPATVRTRWASHENRSATPGAGGTANRGRKGSPAFELDPGEARVLAEAHGTSGCIRRIWITILDVREAATAALVMRGMRLRCFWDSAKTPAIDAPLGDFFCQGLGRPVAFENALFSNPEARSFVCVLPMPFRSGMRIELINETGKRQEGIFYDVDFTIGDMHGPETCYLHAHWRREASGRLGEDYAFLPEVRGRGRFVGVCASVIPNTGRYGRSWWGEGEVKIYLDGDDALPTLCGTGTEDYIGSAWGQGQYANRWQGCPVADEKSFRFAFYRLHGPDPVYFHERLRVTIQRMGYYHPEHLSIMRATGTRIVDITGRMIDLERPIDADMKGLNEREDDDWSSCAWFYLDQTENGLPPLAPVEERITRVL